MSKILIMAEAGVNHNGSLAIAKRLADMAKKAGADIVKYQTFVPEALVSQFAQKAEYQQKNDPNSESQLDMLRKLALSNEDFVELRDYCNKIGIKFLSTPFDFPSIDFLDSIGMDMWKIPSGEITNMPYLIKIAKTGKPVILSTGMSNVNDVENAVRILKDNGCGDISILHCTTQYPAPVEYINLKAMDTLRKKFGCKVGLSDHSLGIEVSIAAAALG
ncbi:MAG: N-acetylneuraminate synthase family protein, partial [Clostridia bacterium]|nr:N-acetylneuraminate synthase family protein [Clostridia bacterium]